MKAQTTSSIILIWIWVAEHVYSIVPFGRRMFNLRLQDKYLLKYLSFHREWQLHWTETLLAGFDCIQSLELNDPRGTTLIELSLFWPRILEVKRSSAWFSALCFHFLAAATSVLLSIEYSGGKIQIRFSSLVKQILWAFWLVMRSFPLVKNFVSCIWLVYNATRSSWWWVNHSTYIIKPDIK